MSSNENEGRDEAGLAAQGENQEASEDNVEDEPSEEEKCWWEVTRNATVSGRLDGFAAKGRERRNSCRTVSFEWGFKPSELSSATRSPWFDWLGMAWSVRFQRSPFDPRICHPPAWSLFLDLKPPYTRIHRIAGAMHLRDGTTLIELWKFEEKFEPAWEGQELCTWCLQRRSLEPYVESMKGKDITLQIKLSTIGLGHALTLAGAYSKLGRETALSFQNWNRHFHDTLRLGYEETLFKQTFRQPDRVLEELEGPQAR
jgi:hypothetical protein